MRILAIGGGSGGHVTPIVAVLDELIKNDSTADIRVWCDRAFEKQTIQKLSLLQIPIRVDTIFAGKLRRYHTLPLWKQLLRLRTIVLPNIRDSFLIGLGGVQSFIKLIVWRPNVIFCKGGFVCLPVGLAAKVLKIPIVLHDSDAHPGLTNRVLSRWASAIATGAPLENYHYSEKIARYVGIPVDPRFRRYSPQEIANFKQSIGFGVTKPLVVITGGGLGAQAINDATTAVLDELLKVCNVLLICGTGEYKKFEHLQQNYLQSQFQLHAFIGATMLETLAAADLVVARAGATTLLELAALAKPAIIVPSPYLTGGHQLKNAAVYVKKDAAVVIDEVSMTANPHELLDTVHALLMNPEQMCAMGEAVHDFARPNAAKDVALMIQAAAKS